MRVCREKAPFMLLIEVLSNDESSSVTEDAQYSAGSAPAAGTPSQTAPRAAGGSRTSKTVPRPYSPPGGRSGEGAAAEGEQQSSGGHRSILHCRLSRYPSCKLGCTWQYATRIETGDVVCAVPS